MAAATAYPEGPISTPTSKVASTTTTRSGGKRKRDASPAAATRSAPATRRSAQTTAPAEATNLNEDTPASGFDLSALQADQAASTTAQPQQPHAPDVDTAAAALNYNMDPSGSGFQLQPADANQDFSMQNHANNSNGVPSNGATSPTAPMGDAPPVDPSQSPTMEAQPSNPLSPSGGLKPAVGSTEWHKVRKDNHKEVERRRRETINEGINELAKTVPGCEKNKGSILQRAVQYIQKLQDDSQANIDKWTFEKMVTEQAISDLSGKLERIQAEKETWKRAAAEAGVDVERVSRSISEEEEARAAAEGDGAK
ncbi:MAG: hypothetical protein Q9159_007281 [Coniocarpon cinnabarinum]